MTIFDMSLTTLFAIFGPGVFESAVNKGVQNISFGDLSGNLGQTMY
jgi:hypothetical protein